MYSNDLRIYQGPSHVAPRKTTPLYEIIERIKDFLLAHLWLLALGVSMECIYLFYLVCAFPLPNQYQSLADMGMLNSYSRLSFTLFLLFFSLLFALVLLAWREASHHQGKAMLYLILGFGALFACTTLFAYPITAIDIYGYIAQSRVLVLYHANPMVVAPAHFTQDPLFQSLGSFVAIPAPYGPVGVLVDALPTVLAGPHLLANLLAFKGFSALFVLGSTYLVYKITTHVKPEMALANALLFAWSPFVQLEYVVNGHNDSIVIFFFLLATFAFMHNRYGLAFTLILLSSLIKYSLVPLIPLFFIVGLSYEKGVYNRLRYTVYVCLITVALPLMLIWPFWQGTQTFASLSAEAQGYLYSFSMFIHGFAPVGLEQARNSGLAIFVGGYLCVAWFAFRRRLGLPMSCFLVLLFFLAFATTYVQPWYFLWVFAPALLIVRRRMHYVALLLTYGATLMELVHPYIWPWGVYQNANGYAIANSVVYLILFAPTLCLLAGYSLEKLMARWRPVRLA